MVACFPELTLYLVAPTQVHYTFQGTQAKPGEIEYLRTIGALFSIYWLMRLDLPLPGPEQESSRLEALDGHLGFCFGDATWRAFDPHQHRANQFSGTVQRELKKRTHFMQSCEWKTLQELFTRAYQAFERLKQKLIIDSSAPWQC